MKRDQSATNNLLSRRASGLQHFAPLPTLHIHKERQTYEDYLRADGFSVGQVLAPCTKGEGFVVRSVKKVDEDELSPGCSLAAKCSNELHSTGCLSDKLVKEYEILKGLKHPNIVVAMHLVQAPVGCAMVMELCIGERLDRLAAKEGGLPAGTQRTIIDQVLCAAVYLHKEHVAHCDLHGGNIIVNPTDLTVKVLDFNCACRERVPIKAWCTSYSETEDQPLELVDLNQSILPPMNKEGGWDMFSLDVFAIGLLTLGLMTARTILVNDVVEGVMLKSLFGVEFPRNAECYVQSLLSYQPTVRPSVALAHAKLPNVNDWPLVHVQSDTN